MKILLAPLFLMTPGFALAQAIQPGGWDIKSTAVDLDIPGAPHFLLRMMTGKSKHEQKCIAPDQAKAGIAAVIAPDPKAKCRIESQKIDGGRFEQMLQCPQKQGSPLRVSRAGSYTAAGFTARLTTAGQTPKGAMRAVIDQVATRKTPSCGK